MYPNSEFINIDNSRTSGHGLGLYLSDQLTRYLGGEIVVKSDPGEGTSVRIIQRVPVQKYCSDTSYSLSLEKEYEPTSVKSEINK